jgi:cap2 methyltransferase
MINEDKLILSSWNNWTFLKDNTGNLMRRENVEGFVEEQGRRLGPVHFVTADGSRDCQDNPGEQEATVSQLHFAEIISALQTLVKGGSFVMKIFTFLECKTICHLYLLACTFKEVRVKDVVSCPAFHLYSVKTKDF